MILIRLNTTYQDWELLIKLSTTHQTTYSSSDWLLLVRLTTTRQTDYYSSDWLLLIRLTTTRQTDYYSSDWLLLVSLGTPNQTHRTCDFVWKACLQMSQSWHTINLGIIMQNSEAEERENARGSDDTFPNQECALPSVALPIAKVYNYL